MDNCNTKNGYIAINFFYFCVLSQFYFTTFAK